MNAVDRFPNWLDPVPPEHRDLAPAFDAANRAYMESVSLPMNVLGSIYMLAWVVGDYLLYQTVFWQLLFLRLCLVATLLSSALAHQQRGQRTVYRRSYVSIAAMTVIVGLMLVVNHDPTGLYGSFLLFIAICSVVFPWPSVWAIRTGLTILAAYLIAGVLGGALDGNPAGFLLYGFALLSIAPGGIFYLHRPILHLRWESFFNQRQVQMLNNLLQEKLDTQLRLYRQLDKEKKRSDDLLNVVIPIGVALSAEQDFDQLLEKIVLEARSFCDADAGTLYLRTQDDRLEFVVVRNDSLGIAMGGTSDQQISLPPLHLHDEATGEPNYHNVATHAALRGIPINVPDAYQAEEFDFSGTQAFDTQTGYRSTSFLTVPLKDKRDHVIGVLQLINAQDPETGQVIPFDKGLQQMVESMSLLAAVALEAYIREQGLRQEIQQLRIELDEAQRVRQVAEIAETDYFQQLRARAKDLRKR